MKSEKTQQPVKAVVCDLDGALLNGTKDVSGATARILHSLADRGVLLILCTGRDPRQISRLLKNWQLADCTAYVIGRYGTSTLSRYENRLTHTGLLAPEDIQALAADAAAARAGLCQVQGRSLVCTHKNLFSLQLAARLRKLPAWEQAPGSRPAAAVYLTGWPGSLRRIRSALDPSVYALHEQTPFRLMVTGSAADPWKALQPILHRHQIVPEEVLTFAAREEYASVMENTLGIAMKNASPELLAVSRGQTKYPGAQDGVAYFLNQQLMSGGFAFGNPACLVPHVHENRELNEEILARQASQEERA